MAKIFNNAGPSVPGQHDMIDPLKRIEFQEIEALIAQQRYFVLHAPRQTGKTTSSPAETHAEHPRVTPAHRGSQPPTASRTLQPHRRSRIDFVDDACPPTVAIAPVSNQRYSQDSGTPLPDAPQLRRGENHRLPTPPLPDKTPSCMPH
jgi:hypothetical protein